MRRPVATSKSAASRSPPLIATNDPSAVPAPPTREPAAATERPDRLEGLQVVLRELTAEGTDEQLVGDGDDDPHGGRVSVERADTLAGLPVEDHDPLRWYRQRSGGRCG